MLTKNEITSLNLSPTKKDFVQIWNELLEVAGKLSERWDPTSTNESDPGIVILKALTGIADKLNYNIDKNTLEAFMPTAAQEDSMRKLCDMLGYSVKYYQSAETSVSIKYRNSDPTDKEKEAMKAPGLLIPKFTVITNSDQNVSYFTTNTYPVYISAEDATKTFNCMEGQVVKCESANDNNVITANQISENNRFYLPETQIAENGIFIYNFVYNELETGTVFEDSIPWEKVDNLNTQARGSRVYKFGFDSYEGRPYIEFPEDYSDLFNDGIFIYYTRTSGVNGNISSGTLTQLELPSGDRWGDVAAESFSVENTFAATTGTNAETIKQAYNNFKKTIGTFETLVTCRDYMNKIYLMTNEHNKPLVSNILVTDIRNDLNRAVTICSCDDAGIFYKEVPLSKPVEEPYEVEIADTKVTHESDILKPTFDGNNWFVGGLKVTKRDSLIQGETDFNGRASGTVGTTDVAGEKFYTITQEGKTFVTNIKPAVETVTISGGKQKGKRSSKKPLIDHFDLVLYPFKSYNQIKSYGQIKTGVSDIREVYDASFNYNQNSFKDITNQLDTRNIQTIAHTIKSPEEGDVISINNYYKLNATIATNSKITNAEGTLLIDTIKIALANAFNMRELDFGEEIPFESLVETIEKADPRIKMVSLNEPALYTTFSVLTGFANGTPIIKEYAVASKWLNEEDAKLADRFNIDKVNDKGEPISTFDVNEARKIYNKLAVRNVLAGRVPLFNYYNTFKPSFSENVYRITRNTVKQPLGLATPTADNPYTIYMDGNKTCTGRWESLDRADCPDNLSIPDKNNPIVGYVDVVEKVTYVGEYDEGAEGEGNTANYHKIIFTETFSPEEYQDNIITTVNDNAITKIATECLISTDEGNTKTISDVKLGGGEFIKFRAPNFKTTKTYPAYVNYNLSLNTELRAEAINAEAYTLFSILDTDRGDWDNNNQNIKWQKVLNYFDKIGYKKKFKLSQKVSKYSKAVGDFEETLDGPIIIKVENTGAASTEETAKSLLAKSGCVKLCNAKPTLSWAPSDGEAFPSTPAPDLDIKLEINNPFITDSNTLDEIMRSVTDRLDELKSIALDDTNETPVLPTECAWTISFEFECVPFEAESFAAWETFIKSSNKEELLGFIPSLDGKVLFWRVYGEGYPAGRYILDSTKKLIKFDTTQDFTGLSNPLQNIYLVKNLGKDSEPIIINNNEEYELQQDEFLYIEYTPSTTTEDGATQELEAKKEIYGPGTIIRPSGFETGLMDSSVYTSLGHTPFKTVSFDTDAKSGVPVDMQRFGASEQVEIREFSEITLSKDSPTIYVYKNFNGCDELEKPEGKAGVRSYTLKDGEYIFYTDQNKTEFAYFGTGTLVKLAGSVTIPQFDVVDLFTIFNSGIQEIPWRHRALSGNDKIIFQEYQYVTLGPEDTLSKLVLSDSDGTGLSSEWKPCDEVEYLLAGAEQTTKLPTINVRNLTENGWKASASFELDVSYDSAQTLRNDGKVQTKLVLTSTSTGGKGESDPMTIEVKEPGDPPISFKTNLICQTSSNQISIDDIYTNPNKLKGFELKVFAKDEPVIVETLPGEVIPYGEKTDLIEWQGVPIADTDTAWSHVNLEDINVGKTDLDATQGGYDGALRLPVSILPNTYGAFCIYLDYAKDDTTVEQKTWIEVLPGTPHESITLLNKPDEEIIWEEDKSDRLLLTPGINCIRVNNTGRIFIKSNAKGALYFDELRLVNCQIEYEDGDKNKISCVTHGLNLKQLGYLPIIADNNKTISEETKEVLRKGYIEKALADISEYVEEDKADFLIIYNDLLSVKSKIHEIVEIEENIKNDLEHLKNDYLVENDEEKLDKLKDLLGHYLQIEGTLATEEALKKALEDNKSIEELEQKLSDLLVKVSTSEVLQQQLLSDLDALKTEVVASAKAFSKEEILADFRNNMNTVDTGKLTDELKIAAREKVEAQYIEQLTNLASDIEKVVNQEDKTKLLAIFNDLRISAEQAGRNNLATEVRQLINTVENSEAEAKELLNTAWQAALDLDYKNLDTILIRLYDILTTLNRPLSEEFELAVGESADDRLRGLIDKLMPATNKVLSDLMEQALEAIGSITFDASEGVKGSGLRICLALADYQSTSLSEPSARGILGMLAGIRTDILNVYDEQLKTVLDGIKSTVDDLETTSESYSTVIESLQTCQDDYANSIVDRLSLIVQQRGKSLGGINGWTKTNLSNFDEIAFGKEAVITVWVKYMRHAFTVGIESIYEEVYEVITDPTKNSSIDDIFATIASRPALFNNNTIIAFKDIFKQAQVLKTKRNQSSASQELISSIGALIQTPSKVTEAFEAIGNNKRTAVICDRITKLSDTSISISEKQRIRQSLKDELELSISEDKQLLSIIAGLICPSLLLIDDSLTKDEEEFYKQLLEEIKSQKEALFAADKESITTRVEYIQSIFESAYRTDSAIEAKLIDIDIDRLSQDTLETLQRLEVEDSLLPSDFIASTEATGDTEAFICKIDELKAAVSILVNVYNLLTSDLSDLEGYDELLPEKPEGGVDDPYEVYRDTLTALLGQLSTLHGLKPSTEVLSTLELEQQLLKEIRDIDTEHDFYYTAPVENSLAIEFNESDTEQNTLMNPAIYYDVNNVNNNFVISKLDIDYLDAGIQIARSSRLN